MLNVSKADLLFENKLNNLLKSLLAWKWIFLCKYLFFQYIQRNYTLFNVQFLLFHTLSVEQTKRNCTSRSWVTVQIKTVISIRGCMRWFIYPQREETRSLPSAGSWINPLHWSSIQATAPRPDWPQCRPPPHTVSQAKAK